MICHAPVFFPSASTSWPLPLISDLTSSCGLNPATHASHLVPCPTSSTQPRAPLSPGRTRAASHKSRLESKHPKRFGTVESLPSVGTSQRWETECVDSLALSNMMVTVATVLYRIRMYCMYCTVRCTVRATSCTVLRSLALYRRHGTDPPPIYSIVQYCTTFPHLGQNTSE